MLYEELLRPIEFVTFLMNIEDSVVSNLLSLLLPILIDFLVSVVKIGSLLLGLELELRVKLHYV